LLFALTVAAQHGKGRPAVQPRKLLAGFLCDGLDEGAVLLGVVHVGEHEILPQQDAVGIAQVEEVVALVDHHAADAQHVHSGRAHLGQRSHATCPRAH